VVVAVPDEDTTRVMLGASLGEVRLALHGAPKRGESGDDAADGFVEGSSSPAAMAKAERLAIYGADVADNDAQAITLRELTALKRGRETPRGGSGAVSGPKKEPASAIVHRGADTEKVSRDGIVLK
jgi:pilus assembly protein CpaB